MLNEQDKLKELFSEKLGSFEAPVNPELWNAIASKMAATSAVTSSGLSLLTKTIIGIAAAGVVGVGTYFIVQSSTNAEATSEFKPASKVETTSEKEVIESVSAPIDEQSQLQQQSTTVSTELNLAETNNVNENEVSTMIVDAVEFTPIQKKELKESVLTISNEEKKEIIPTTPKKIIPVEEHNEVAVFHEPQVVPSATIKQLSNVFSPDGDGVNDELFIEFTGELLDFSLIVMDEKNQTIYQSRDANFRWNGIMMNGNPAPVGNYYYVITARDLNGSPINKYSRLSIFR